MKNAAIFYDIENLIGGYGNPEMLATLSLSSIYNEIKKSIQDAKILIQKAYANWSNPALSILKGDIVELGIDPIQMFGFGKASQKNASDIQLAVDAIETLFTKNYIDTFIIVSGDGGFSTLAKKIHEYGKYVIGCAYNKTVNKIFASVCDDFIWIESPKVDIINNLNKTFTKNITQNNGISVSTSNITNITNPIVLAYAKEHQPTPANDANEIFNISKDILNFLAKNRDAGIALYNIGLNISVLSEILNYRIPDFNYYKLGFAKFTDFIRYITYESPIKLVFKNPSEYRLIYKEVKLRMFEDAGYIKDLTSLHNVENYRKILETGAPLFKQFDKEIIFTISDYLSTNKLDFQDISLGEIIDKIYDTFNLEQTNIKKTITTLLSSNCFIKNVDNLSLAEAKFSFVPTSASQALQMVQNSMNQKLTNLLGHVDNDVFSKIFSYNN